MDLYADLPLAEGAATTALDADGKLKSSSGTSVWTTTAAPAFVPQVVRASANAPQQAARGKDATEPASARPPPIATKSAVSMLPAALRTKSPNAAAGASTTSAATSGSISLAFKPASITRKSPQPLASSSCDDTRGTLESAEPRTRGLGFGFAAAVTTEVRIQQPHVNSSTASGASDKDAAPHGESDWSAAPAVATGAGFFHTSYRDEYNPARPNSYEAYCEERVAKKKLELVKRELDRRQREQEREGKLEREKLVRDIEAGTAPTAQLAAAGRGRGMTVPAWMRKKMEETAAAKSTGAPQQQPPRNELDQADADQFEDAPPRAGLGFGAPSRADPSPSYASAGLGFRSSDQRSTSNSSSNGSNGRMTHRAADPVQSQQPRVESARGCVVLLQNMVGPGEVDDELQDEVKEECEAKYGGVAACVVYEVPASARVPPEQAVRIFVQFERPGDAEKARLGLNARFFGGRKVHAALFDDTKFHLRDYSL